MGRLAQTLGLGDHMIIAHKLKAKTYGALAVVFLLCLLASIFLLTRSPESVPQFITWLLSIGFNTSLIISLWFYLTAKARSKIWLLLLVFNIFGIAAIIGLADKSNATQP